ncbi:MAG: precorrin-8X methylmutase [Roseovarius sp.]|nr:precorrin-8X methylmutase [Roseovarius sp.]MCY4315012.1 precorrin-8X methylmutase [Roseovarius sp.]
MLVYEKTPAAIYSASYAAVRKEASLERFSSGMEKLAIRIIHSCGMPDAGDRLDYSGNAYEAGQKALQSGKPVLCDSEMVRSGIIRRRLPCDNRLIATLNNPEVADRASKIGTTRSAAAVEFWEDYIEGSVVAIGNAPTALFHLLELIDSGMPKPALILGFPVGFVGAAESKAELARNSRGCEYVAIQGRQGGSAMASAAVNALSIGLAEYLDD